MRKSLSAIFIAGLLAALPLGLFADQQTINVGTTPNDDTGDTVRAAFIKVNSNFDELYDSLVYDVGVQSEGKPEANATLVRYIFPRAATFPDEFTGSRSLAAAAATAQTIFSVKKNGSEVGTITFAAAGTTATFVTTGTTVSFAANDVITIVAPAIPDATLSDLAFTLVGTRAPGG